MAFGRRVPARANILAGTAVPRPVVRIRVRAGCKPTESLPRVKIAIVNLFPDARFVREDDVVEAESASLDALRERIRGPKIRDAPRGDPAAEVAHGAPERITAALAESTARPPPEPLR